MFRYLLDTTILSDLLLLIAAHTLALDLTL
jgi:hypothetical protein